MNEIVHMCCYGCGQVANYQLKSGKWCCSDKYQKCPVLKSRNSAGLRRAHADISKYNSPKLTIFRKGEPSWNSGLTKETDERVAKYASTYKEGIASGRLKPSMLGKKASPETREKLRLKALKAHAEGRAHNIGECRWNNQPSWPEQFFMKVIENEFNDKNYIREKSFHKFSLDFAWVDKKLCIEIDGEQHQYGEQPRRDAEKDKLLLSEGWKILRIPWKSMYHDTKYWIAKAKKFIDD